MFRKYIFLLLFFIISIYRLEAQNDYVIVDSIEIEGCRRTKHDIVFRDLYIKVGDTILLDDLSKRMRISEEYLGNTGIFRSNKINIIEWEGDRIVILCKVEEVGYSLPVPSVDLADRNINVWGEHDYSLSRVNFGLSFSSSNLTGHRDRLRTGVQIGYTRKLEVDYLIPYLNKQKTLGINFNILLAKSKELNYVVRYNEEVFYRGEDDFLIKRFRLLGKLLFQPGLYNKNSLSIGYFSNQIDDYVLTELNPEFFYNREKREEYFEVVYNWNLSKLDNKYYPFWGHRLNAEINKKGVGVFGDVNQLTAIFKGVKYFRIRDNQSISIELKAKTSLVRDKPYFYNHRGLGYDENYIRGYERYVMNGYDCIMGGVDYKVKLFKKTIDWKKKMPLKSYRIMPLVVGMRFYSEVGYANDEFRTEDNNLTNTYLWGGGVGIDVLLMRKYLGQIQFSTNRLGEKGIFLHYKFKFE